MSSEELKEKALKMIRQEAEVWNVDWTDDDDAIADIMVRFHEEMSGIPSSLDIIKCSICGNSFAARFPKTGDSVTCPHCGAEGYGTYDEGGNYMLEWYESDTWS